LKIALLTDGIHPFVNGGMQLHSSHLARYFTINNCSVTLFHCIYDSEIPSDYHINKKLFNDESKLFKIVTLKFPKSLKFPWSYLYNSFRYSKNIYDLIKLNIDEYDFIYIQGLSGWKLLKQKSKDNINTKVGVNFHGLNMFYKTKSFKLKLSYLIFKPIVKFNMKSADFNFSFGGRVSELIEKIGISPKNIINIPNGLEHKWIRSIDKIKTSEKLNFIFIGRDDPIKGIKEINKAISFFNDEDFIFHFVGPIKNKIIGKNIKYHGLVKDRVQILKILDQCDILLLPSYSEGMPYAILEAMSRGLAIIASDVGAVNLMVSNKNGILLKSQNHKSIISAIKSLISMETLKLNEMKSNSIRIINNSFTWNIVLKQLISEIKVRIS
tara:strand:- start:2278 stop:3423 length:1146 start_codon:yes stop_codon:yes gene_type:complete